MILKCSKCGGTSMEYSVDMGSKEVPIDCNCKYEYCPKCGGYKNYTAGVNIEQGELCYLKDNMLYPCKPNEPSKEIRYPRKLGGAWSRIKKLESALKKIDECITNYVGDDFISHLQDIAKKALEEE